MPYSNIIVILLAIYNLFLIFLFIYISIKGRKTALLYSFLIFIFFLIIWNSMNIVECISVSLPPFIEKLSFFLKTGFWRYFSINYLIAFYSLVMAFRYVSRLPKKEKWLVSLVIPLGLLIILSDVAYSFPLKPDATSVLSFIFFVLNRLVSIIIVLIFTLELFRNSTFNNLIPISFKSVLSSMETGVLVADYANNLILVNNAFRKAFLSDVNLDANPAFPDVISILNAKTAAGPMKDEVFSAFYRAYDIQYTGELCFDFSPPVYYNIIIQPVISRSREIYGRIITFTDITWYKEYIRELDENNSCLAVVTSELNKKHVELQDLNAQIVTYTNNLTALACENERKKIASKVYSMLDNTFHTVINTLEHVLEICNTNKEETVLNLQEAIDLVRNSFKQVNLSVQKILADTPHFETITNAINHLSHLFAPHGMKIEFSLAPSAPALQSKLIELVHEICHEAFCNSLLHGKAKKVDVILKHCGSIIKLYIFDDGRGCSHIRTGGNLSLIEEKIKKLNGKMSRGSDGIKGFNLVFEIPL